MAFNKCGCCLRRPSTQDVRLAAYNSSHIFLGDAQKHLRGIFFGAMFKRELFQARVSHTQLSKCHPNKLERHVQISGCFCRRSSLPKIPQAAPMSQDRTEPLRSPPNQRWLSPNRLGKSPFLQRVTFLKLQTLQSILISKTFKLWMTSAHGFHPGCSPPLPRPTPPPFTQGCLRCQCLYLAMWIFQLCPAGCSSFGSTPGTEIPLVPSRPARGRIPIFPFEPHLGRKRPARRLRRAGGGGPGGVGSGADRSGRRRPRRSFFLFSVSGQVTFSWIGYWRISRPVVEMGKTSPQAHQSKPPNRKKYILTPDE